jgi:heme/copper-type cytochrome/quinol oxidase subunit 2
MRVRTLVLMLLVIAVAGAALACPTCSETMSDGQNPNGLARGFFWSIIAMLAVPFTLTGGGAFYVWRRIRANDRERHAATLAQGRGERHASPDATT